MKNWRGASSAWQARSSVWAKLMMTAGAARRRANRRGILGIKGRGRAFEMKIGAAFQQSNTAVPAKNAIVVAGRTNFFRFRETAHGFFDQRQKNVRSVPDN